MPGTISRGVARLQLTSLRVAIIGVVRRCCSLRWRAVVPLDLARDNQRAGRSDGLAVLSGSLGFIRPGDPVCSHWTLVATQIRSVREKFRVGGVVMGTIFWVNAGVLAVHLAICCVFILRHQSRPRANRPLPGRLDAHSSRHHAEHPAKLVSHHKMSDMLELAGCSIHFSLSSCLATLNNETTVTRRQTEVYRTYRALDLATFRGIRRL